MKKLIILLCLASCSTTQPKLYGSNKTDNYARRIEISEYMSKKEWVEVLKRQPIKIGKGNPSLHDLVKVQTECNNFNWAHKDENWSTPLEARQKNWGDCKDAAICKYYKLRALGWKPEQLNLWSGWYGKKYEGHLTLAVRLGNAQYILDDMNNAVIPAKEYMHKIFEPYRRLNELGEDF